jgi:hypothetical protein
MVRAAIALSILLTLSASAATSQTAPSEARPVRFGMPQTAAPSTVELPLAPPPLPPSEFNPPPAIPLSEPLVPPPLPTLMAPANANGSALPATWPRAPSAVESDLRLPLTVEAGPTIEASSACVWDAKSWRVFDNLSFFAGLNIAKEPADLGINENFGYRFAVNWGLPLVERAGLGLQVGTALNYSRTALHILPLLDGTVDHFQSFTTLGIFQRSPCGWNWAVVHDFRYDDYYDRFFTGQWRGQLGRELGARDEIGFWGTLHDRNDATERFGRPLSLRPLNQINFYWRHVWPYDAVTRAWIGFTDDHDGNGLLDITSTRVRHPFVFGGDVVIPLNRSLAFFGEAQFVTPNDSGTVSATFGIVWYPGAGRDRARGNFEPLLPVANNTSMPLDLRR